MVVWGSRRVPGQSVKTAPPPTVGTSSFQAASHVSFEDQQRPATPSWGVTPSRGPELTAHPFFLESGK